MAIKLRNLIVYLKCNDDDIRKVRLENYAKLKGWFNKRAFSVIYFQYSTPVYLAPSIMGAQVNSVGAIYSKDLWRKVPKSIIAPCNQGKEFFKDWRHWGQLLHRPLAIILDNCSGTAN